MTFDIQIKLYLVIVRQSLRRLEAGVSMSCSDSGSDDMPLGAQGDLASRTLVLESKRFYLDVKENKRGRFIKIAEISADGRKEHDDSKINSCSHLD